MIKVWVSVVICGVVPDEAAAPSETIDDVSDRSELESDSAYDATGNLPFTTVVTAVRLTKISSTIGSTFRAICFHKAQDPKISREHTPTPNATASFGPKKEATVKSVSKGSAVRVIVVVLWRRRLAAGETDDDDMAAL